MKQKTRYFVTSLCWVIVKQKARNFETVKQKARGFITIYCGENVSSRANSALNQMDKYLFVLFFNNNWKKCCSIF